MRRGEKQFLAVGERRDQRVRPVIEGQREARDRRSRHAVRADDEQGGLAFRLDQTCRLGDAEHLTEPLQSEVRTVGNFTAADEAFEQADTCREKVAVLVGPFAARNSYARDARVRGRPVALNRGSARRVDGQQPGDGRGRR